MATYLVKLKSLEPYTLGTELGFSDDIFSKDCHSSYIATSGEVPDQTTLLGVIRFMVLKCNGLLKPDYSYSSKEKENLELRIGSQSFSFEDKDQTFGAIRKLSPVFIIKESDKQGGEQEYLVPTPACLKKNKDNNSYSFMKISESKSRTNNGKEIALPLEGEYNPKEGYLYEWYNLNKKKPAYDPEDKSGDVIFIHKFVPGNSRKNEDDSFFKREVITLAKDASFAFFVTLDEEVRLENTLCRIGKKGALFSATVTESDDDLESKVKAAFGTEGKKWRYALSDIFVGYDSEWDAFGIVNTHTIRNISQDKNGKRQKGKNRYTLIKAGSVFYGKGKMFNNEHCSTIGYNRMIEIGGES